MRKLGVSIQIWALIVSLPILFQNCSAGMIGFKSDVVKSLQTTNANSISQKKESVHVKNLSRFELAALARDILGESALDLSLVKLLPADTKVGGFDSGADSSFDISQIQARLKFAEAVAERALRSKEIFSCAVPEVPDATWTGCLRTITLRFAEVAFRRPVTADEEAKFFQIFMARHKDVVADLNAEPKSVPVGHFDGVNEALQAQGWTFDPDWSSRAVEIHFYLDGVAGTGTFIGKTFSNSPRPDVIDHFLKQGQVLTGQHGFTFQLPVRLADGQAHQVYAHAVGGTNPLLGSITFQKASRTDTAVATYPLLNAPMGEAIKSVLTYILMTPQTQLKSLQWQTAIEDSARKNYELANRMSWFLRAGPPDATTYSLARDGRLTEDQVYREEVRRLLRTYSRDLSYQFAGQWFGFREFSLQEELSSLDQDMITESKLVFSEILNQNLGADAIIQPGFTFASAALASHYGLSGAAATGFSKMAQAQRGGVLSQGSLLRMTAPNQNTKPIVRGKWFQFNLLCRTIPSPSAELFQEIAKAQAAADPAWSVSRQLEEHRKAGPACAGCHQYMDPLGLALESYGPDGRVRVTYADGKPVETAGFLDSQAFQNASELASLVLQREDFKSCVARKVLSHSLPQALDASDDETIAALTKAKYTVRDLFEVIATSKSFRQMGED